jgi:hypothetical protein
MNQARDRKTNEIIEAEELKLIHLTDISDYECIDENCKIQLIPCSYKPSNKNRPYFKSPKNINHSDNCRFSEFLKLLEQGHKRKLELTEFENMPYPSRLISPKKIKTEEKTTKQDDNIIIEETTGKKRKSTNEFEESANSNRAVTTISQIVDFYLSCPFNRDFELDLLGTKKAYMYWFKRIQKSKQIAKYNGQCIYFGQLHTNMSYVKKTESEILIKLYECEEWVRNTGTSLAFNKSEQKNPFYVKINIENLTSHKISRILNEFQFAIQDQKDAHNNNKDGKKKAYLFFLGEAPVDKDSFTFNVIEGNISARFTEIKPTKNI